MDKYRKLKLVGKGAFGTVYLYEHIADGCHFIIKEIPVEQMSRDDRQSALNESKVLSMLDHPNIIAYHENFLQDKMMLIVMEFAEGGTLCDLLEQRKGQLFTEKEVLQYFVQLVLALEHVHSRSILHRDIKSQNILLNKNKTILKMSDFGISKILASKSRAVTVVGTPYYISPELCEGRPYNQKSDIWALGCILYELITLKKPFDSDNLPALVMKIMKGSFAPIPNDYSRGVKQLVMSMLHLVPNRRPSANQILAQPFLIGTLYKMYMTIGCLPSLPRNDESSTLDQTNSESATSLNSGSSEKRITYVPAKPKLSEVVYLRHMYSGPCTLPLPPDCRFVRCASVGNSQLVGINETRHLVLWKLNEEIGEDFVASVDEFVPDIVAVACGDGFTVCVSDSGVVSILGTLSTHCACYINKPVIVKSLFGYSIVSIACGPKHIMAVSEDGEVFAWGTDDKGCLGYGKSGFYSQPQILKIASKPKVMKVFCGTDCSFAITEEKVLFACGSNRHNKIGMDTEEGLHTEEIHVFAPVRSSPLPTSRVECVASGLYHTAIVLEDGKVYTMGCNRNGQLGWGVRTLTHTMPGLVLPLASFCVSDIACGDLYTVALTKDGSMFSWGLCPPTLCIDESGNVTKINCLSFLKGKKVLSISCYMKECLIVTR